MHRDRDFDLGRELPPHAATLTQDLELETLLNAMAGGDEFLLEIVRRGLLASVLEPQEILYRQGALADCIAHEQTVRDLYEIAVDAVYAERKAGMFFSLRHAGPGTVLSRSVRVLEVLVDVLERIRKVADEEAAGFRSEAFARFFSMLEAELGDEYLARIRGHLRELKFDRGVLISAELGRANKGVDYVLRRPHARAWIERLPGKRPPTFSFTIPPRDEGGFQALEEIRNRGINLVGNALGQSTDHVVSFFRMLRAELGFYLGVLNLIAALGKKSVPTCFPEPLPASQTALSFEGLHDAALAFHLDAPVVGNDVEAEGKSLVMITGANQGGKSTFLRSVGIAQLMMQSGMVVAARAFRANVCSAVFTHYKKEEDASMEGGKLDEELARMSEVADQISPGALLLCNESFAATNEREGSEIARQVIRAMIEERIKVMYVTHLYDLAQSVWAARSPLTLFLRAERLPDGRRTFRLLEGEPLPTSFGGDSFRRIFGRDVAEAVKARAGRQ